MPEGAISLYLGIPTMNFLNIDLEAASLATLLASALAGFIAAVFAAGFLELARFCRRRRAKRLDEEYIREILVQGQKRVLAAEETAREATTESRINRVRASHYNLLLREIGIAFERWAVDLTHDQRKEIYDALDWYNMDNLTAAADMGMSDPEPVEGRLPGTEISRAVVQMRFEKLALIKWLGLEDGPKPKFWVRWWRRVT